jgi:flagellar protein FlbD
VIKVTRLNNHLVAINPDHIGWVDATPDTTLFLIGGEKIIIRETVDQLIESVVEFRRRIRWTEPSHDGLGAIQGDPPRTAPLFERRGSDRPGRSSDRPARPSDAPPRISDRPPASRGGS